MTFAVDKVKSTGNQQVWLTERGTLFGPSELVVDFRNLHKLAALTDHVVMDCTHSAQETGSNNGTTGGNRAMYLILQRPLTSGVLIPSFWKRIHALMKAFQTAQQRVKRSEVVTELI